MNTWQFRQPHAKLARSDENYMNTNYAARQFEFLEALNIVDAVTLRPFLSQHIITKHHGKIRII